MTSKVNKLKPEIIEAIHGMMQKGEPINAILLIRQELQCGLAAAKEEYELYIEERYRKTTQH